MVSESLLVALSYLSEPVKAAILTIANAAAARAGGDVAIKSDGMISAGKIAAENGLSDRVVRRHLKRWRNLNRAWRPDGETYLYDRAAVGPLISSMQQAAAVRRSVRQK